MKPKILSIGSAYFEINCTDFPCKYGLAPNKEIVGKDYTVFLGGSALNFSRVCASLGLAPAFIGKTGKDTLGKIIPGLMVEAGIIPALISSSDVSTLVSLNFIDTNGSSIMNVAGTASQSLKLEEIENKIDTYIDDIKYLYFGGCLKLKSLLPSYKIIAQKAQKIINH